MIQIMAILQSVQESIDWIKQNPKPVQDFLSGNENAVKFLVGQTMKL